MQHFEGKTAFLTGAASGIGRAIAMELARLRCNLYLVDVDAAALEKVREQASACGITARSGICDLADPRQVDAAVTDCLQQFAVVDLLINNAGVAYYGPTHLMTAQQWDWLMSINLSAPIQLTRLLLPHLLARPEAHIVNMCSIAGLVAGGRSVAYQTSKYGLVGFTEAIRAEYGRTGLGVSAICPGPVRTNLYKAAATGRDGTTAPCPPAVFCTTPERVAARTIQAIRRNHRQVLISPMAHLLFQMKRFVPGLIDFANQFSRKKKKRRAARLLAEQQRLSDPATASGTDVHRAA